MMMKTSPPRLAHASPARATWRPAQRVLSHKLTLRAWRPVLPAPPGLTARWLAAAACIALPGPTHRRGQPCACPARPVPLRPPTPRAPRPVLLALAEPTVWRAPFVCLAWAGLTLVRARLCARGALKTLSPLPNQRPALVVKTRCSKHFLQHVTCDLDPLI
jgi:hypothetical protein